MAGLHKLGLLNGVQYMGGCSGGSWATGAYTFAQNNVSDEVLLGPVTSPEDITLSHLRTRVPGSLRTAFADIQFIPHIVLKLLEDGLDFRKAWVQTVRDQVLGHAGVNVKGKMLPALSHEHVAEYCKKYPGLFEPHDFVVPSKYSAALEIHLLSMYSYTYI